MSKDSSHIRVTKDQHSLIKKAALKGKKSMGEWAYQCTYFVYKHRYDPYLMEEILINEEFKGLRKDLIGFIRKQEEKILKPVLDQVNGMSRTQIELTHLLQEVLSQNANLVDDLGDSIDTPGAESTDAQNDFSEELARKDRIISDKDKTIQKMREALQTMKNASLERRGQVFLGISMDDFQKLVSLA